jgi:hypothetical protein
MEDNFSTEILAAGYLKVPQIASKEDNMASQHRYFILGARDLPSFVSSTKQRPAKDSQKRNIQ